MASTHSHTYESMKLLERLDQAIEQEAAVLSGDVLLAIEKRLSETLSNIRSAINSRTVLCGLPTEILAAILQEIPSSSVSYADSQLAPFWDPLMGDSSLLIPISRTCRRLRAVALSLTGNWSQFATTDPAIISHLLRRIKEKPITIVLCGNRLSKMLRRFYCAATPRPRELFLWDLSIADMQTFWSYVNRLHTRLWTLSCCVHGSLVDDWESRHMTLSLNQYPHLRHLVLVGVIFDFVRTPLSSLTHIVLARINMPDLHNKVVTLLTQCPKLRKLVLSNSHELNNVDIIPRRHRFPSLQQVVLHDMDAGAIRFYSRLFQFGATGASLQVVNCSVSHGDLAHEQVVANHIESVDFLAVSTFKARERRGHHIWSITLSDGSKALRLASNGHLLHLSTYVIPMTWIERLLADKPRLLSTVGEVWLVNPSTNVDCDSYQPMLTSVFTTVLNTLSELHTLVLVTADPDRYYWLHPDISALPIYPGATSPFHLPKLKTLRLIYYRSPGHAHGNDNSASAPFARDFVPRKLDLDRLYRQLKSREYRYLRHLVLQMTPHFFVAKRELEKLRSILKTCTFQRITQVPQMPLPQACVEMDHGPGGSCVWTQTLG